MKKAIIFIIIAALVLTVTPALIFAGNNGPAKKVTGEVLVPVRGWYAEFNAHEAFSNKVYAKGAMRMWSDEVGRDLYLEVKYVNVEGDTAWFSAKCTYDSWGKVEDKWLFVKVIDNGSPGIYNDEIGWDWTSGKDESLAEKRVTGMDDSDNNWTVQDGNLVVHSYE